jgi:tetratricopeptide (TPR) repeat protein
MWSWIPTPPGITVSTRADRVVARVQFRQMPRPSRPQNRGTRHIIQADNGAILFFSRQYDRSIEQFQAVLKVEPNFSRARMLNYVYAQQGRYAEALANIEEWRRVYSTYWPLTEEGYVYGRAGQLAQARRALEKLEALNRREQIDPFAFVAPYVGLGDKEQAFAWLEKSLANHSPGLTALKVDPIFDPLRNDSRFEAILQRLGLAQ